VGPLSEGFFRAKVRWKEGEGRQAKKGKKGGGGPVLLGGRKSESTSPRVAKKEQTFERPRKVSLSGSVGGGRGTQMTKKFQGARSEKFAKKINNLDPKGERWGSPFPSKKGNWVEGKKEFKKKQSFD